MEIEIFTADTKASKGITAAQVAECAACFDGDRNPGPVVMGHPKDDASAPAFGAVTALRAEGSKLFGTITNLAKEAVDGVRQKRILNRSAAFWHPDHPSNPNPGKLSFRHLGLLGGTPPGIPNMAPLRFDADAGESGQLVVDGDAAEPLIFAPTPEGAKPMDMDQLAAAVAEKLKPNTEPTEPKKEFAVDAAEIKAAQDKLAADQAAMDEREAAIAAKEAQFAADEAKREADAKDAREKDNLDFADKLVSEGKFPAGHKDDLAAILNAMPQETLEFSGDHKEAPGAALRRILDTAAPQFIFAHVTEDATNFAAGNSATDEAAALKAADERQASAWKGNQAK